MFSAVQPRLGLLCSKRILPGTSPRPSKIGGSSQRTSGHCPERKAGPSYRRAFRRPSRRCSRSSELKNLVPNSCGSKVGSRRRTSVTARAASLEGPDRLVHSSAVRVLCSRRANDEFSLSADDAAGAGADVWRSRAHRRSVSPGLSRRVPLLQLRRRNVDRVTCLTHDDHRLDRCPPTACGLEPIPEPPGTVPIFPSPRGKMGLSPSPRRFWDRL